MSKLSKITSVTRWLTVVVGCAVLETAQPMIAADAPPPVARTGDTVLFPAGLPAPGSPDAPAPGSGSAWLLVVIVLLAAGGFVLLRRRTAGAASRRSAGLAVEETRALGNRQFLMVAACDGRRYLLGVTPGGINLLAPLDGKETSDARPEA